MKKGLLSTLLLMLMLHTLPAAAQSQSELNAEACAESRNADSELNKVYRQILREYADDTRFIAKLRVAQRAWVTWRDAELGALYPAADPRSEYGSVFDMCRCGAAAELTEARVAQLRRWVDGAEEGDVCAGSRRDDSLE